MSQRKPPRSFADGFPFGMSVSKGELIDLPREFLDIFVKKYFGDPIIDNLPWKDLRSYVPTLQNKLDQAAQVLPEYNFVTTKPSDEEKMAFINLFPSKNAKKTETTDRLPPNNFVTSNIQKYYLDPTLSLKNIATTYDDVEQSLKSLVEKDKINDDEGLDATEVLLQKKTEKRRMKAQSLVDQCNATLEVLHTLVNILLPIFLIYKMITIQTCYCDYLLFTHHL